MTTDAVEGTATDDATDDATAADDKPTKARTGKDTGTGKAAPKPAVRARPRLGRRTITTAALVAVTAAALFAGAATWRYVGRDDTAGREAALRDQVAAAATQDVINLNTLDYRTTAADLDRWQNSATGTLYAQITSGRAQLEAEAAKDKTVSTAAVLAVAVTEFDRRAGKAAVLATVRVTVTKSGGTGGAAISRLIGQLSRTPAGWKMSTLSSAGGGE
ncbi:hypothetical protein [Actinomadura verrucosospora]|uniref:Membrane protein n=1 Tax=Actinomadura verrucosospora TaxID=46165 RepID=A0A7D4ABK9_ACTVE|nr:hypothetical protein [Actinomadura verrucosospora]QKG27085.1 membrane protein [Actinomadura verrucosospora]